MRTKMMPIKRAALKTSPIEKTMTKLMIWKSLKLLTKRLATSKLLRKLKAKGQMPLLNALLGLRDSDQLEEELHIWLTLTCSKLKVKCRYPRLAVLVNLT